MKLNDCNIMGQAAKKMKRGISTAVDTKKDTSTPVKAHHDDYEDTSTSSQWMTEMPTRSSSQFSKPTGQSRFSSSQDASPVKSVQNDATKSQQKVRKSSSDGMQESEAVLSLSNTSGDHPPLTQMDIYSKDYVLPSIEDQEWQNAVNAFLRYDPISKTPRPKARAEYLMHRNYVHKRDVGFRWRKSVEKFQARQHFPSIPIPGSEFSYDDTDSSSIDYDDSEA